jgi:uncharacterized protein
MEPSFQIFVKPVGAKCNLDCNYCYYLKNNALNSENEFRMKDELLENYISQHINSAKNDPVVFFSWHGGEPTLAGIDFYKKALSYQKKYVLENQIVFNGIQTNGTLLNNEWADFLSRENFIVGISLDGTETLHNQFRKNSIGKGSFEQVLQGIGLLKKSGIIPEILCVVNAVNVHFPLEIYRFFKELGVQFITFLPLVEYCSEAPSKVSSDSVGAKDFGNFLVCIFDEWVENDIGEIKIQIFEETLRTAINQDHSLCIFKKNCGRVPVLELNGDFYSCDHFVEKTHFLGNINSNSISYYLESAQQKIFGEKKSKTLPEYCLKCEVLEMCNGECPKNLFIQTSGGEDGLNYLCEGYQLFFKHCQPFIEEIKKLSEKQNRN